MASPFITRFWRAYYLALASHQPVKLLLLSYHLSKHLIIGTIFYPCHSNTKLMDREIEREREKKVV